MFALVLQVKQAASGVLTRLQGPHDEKIFASAIQFFERVVKHYSHDQQQLDLIITSSMCLFTSLLIILALNIVISLCSELIETLVKALGNSITDPSLFSAASIGNILKMLVTIFKTSAK